MALYEEAYWKINRYIINSPETTEQIYGHLVQPKLQWTFGKRYRREKCPVIFIAFELILFQLYNYLGFTISVRYIYICLFLNLGAPFLTMLYRTSHVRCVAGQINYNGWPHPLCPVFHYKDTTQHFPLRTWKIQKCSNHWDKENLYVQSWEVWNQ